MRDKWETSVKCKIMRPKAPRVGDKCGRRVGDKCKLWETSVNSCGPRHPEWETSVENKCGKQMWETSVGNKGETSVNSCDPRHPE